MSKDEGHITPTIRVRSTTPKPSPTSRPAQRSKERGKKLSVSRLLAQVSSNDPKGVYDALSSLRSEVLRLKDGVVRIRERGGAHVLLGVLEHGDQKVVDVCVSILGNCCMDDKFRTEVIQKDGVAVIGTVLQETKSTSIQNRSCRTLANIALDSAGSKKIHEEDLLVECIIRILSETKDPGSQQTFIRIIRLLSDTRPHRVALLKDRGLKVVADLLKSTDDGVSMAALKTVSHYIHEHPTEQCALQLDLAETCSFILTSATDQKQNVAGITRRLIAVMVKHECFRPGLGNAGSIAYFLEKIADDAESIDHKYAYINSLCLSCKESLNRVRIRERQGLEVLLDAVRDDRYRQIHNRIISALLCFLYDEPGIQILLKNGIVETLMKQLARCVNRGITGESDSMSLLLDRALSELLDDVVIHEVEQPPQEVGGVTDVVPDEVTSVAGQETTGLGRSQEPVVFVVGSGDESIFSRTSDDQQKDHAEVPDRMHDVNSQTSDEDHSQNDLCPRKTLVKYSMDSPTYKEISKARTDCNYDPLGPTNILSGQDFGGLSPGYSSPTWSLGSPMSTGSSLAETDSPLSAVSSYVSPQRSPRMSPTRDDVNQSPRPWSEYGSSSNLAMSPSPQGQFSPLQECVYSSPTKSPSYHVFFHDGVPSPSYVFTKEGGCEQGLQYSSEEELQTSSRVGDLDVKESSKAVVSHSEFNATTPDTEGRINRSQAKCDASAVENIPSGTSSTDDRKRHTEGVHNSEVATPLKTDKDATRSTTTTPNLGQNVDVHAEDTNSMSTAALPHMEHKDGIVTTEANILIFLSRVSFMDSPEKYVASSLVIEGILNFLIHTTQAQDANWSRAHRILLRIFKLPTAFDRTISAAMPLVINLTCSKFIKQEKEHVTPSETEADQRSNAASHSKANLCSESVETLSLIAQNRYGQGVVKHALMAGSFLSRMKAFLSVPLLYSNSKELKYLLSLVPQGVEVAMHCLAAKNDVLTTAAVVFISHVTSVCLGHHGYADWNKGWYLHADRPQTRKRKRSSSQEDPIPSLKGCSRHGEPPELDVTFMLPDGSQIRASRSKMSSASTVFSAMLEGSFSESSKTVIDIADTDSASFSLFVDYLHTRYCQRVNLLQGSKPDTLLATLVLAERYLVPELHHDISIKLEQTLKTYLPLEYDINDHNVQFLMNVLQTSLIHNCYYIAERTLAWLLDTASPLTFRHGIVKKCICDDGDGIDKAMLTSMRSVLNLI